MSSPSFTSLVDGGLFGLWPICHIVLSALFLYDLCVSSGHFAAVRYTLSALTSDRRCLALLLGYSFSGFMEGASGFATPVVLATSMLVGLGFTKHDAIRVALIGNSVPVAFGGLGVPTITLAALTKIDPMILGQATVRLMLPFSLLVPWLLVHAVSPTWKDVIEVWPACVTASFVHTGVSLLIVQFIGPQLPSLLSMLITLFALGVLFKVWQPVHILLPNECMGNLLAIKKADDILKDEEKQLTEQKLRLKRMEEKHQQQHHQSHTIGPKEHIFTATPVPETTNSLSTPRTVASSGTDETVGHSSVVVKRTNHKSSITLSTKELQSPAIAPFLLRTHSASEAIPSTHRQLLPNEERMIVPKQLTHTDSKIMYIRRIQLDKNMVHRLDNTGMHLGLFQHTHAKSLHDLFHRSSLPSSTDQNGTMESKNDTKTNRNVMVTITETDEGNSSTPSNPSVDGTSKKNQKDTAMVALKEESKDNDETGAVSIVPASNATPIVGATEDRTTTEKGSSLSVPSHDDHGSGGGPVEPTFIHYDILHPPSLKEIILGWLPWIIVCVLVGIWGSPEIKAGFSPTLFYIIIPSLDGEVQRAILPGSKSTTPTIMDAKWKVDIVGATGSCLLICAFVTALLYQLSYQLVIKAYVRTVKRMFLSFCTVMLLLAFGYVLRYSGQDSTLGVAAAEAGKGYPILSSVIGFLGVALTGSATTSNVIFGGAQYAAASALGLNPIHMAASNTVSGCLGHVTSVSSIVVAAVASGDSGKNVTVIAKSVIGYALFLLAVMMVWNCAIVYGFPSLIPSL